MEATSRSGGASRRNFLMSLAGLSWLALAGCGGGSGGTRVPGGIASAYGVRLLGAQGRGGWIFPRAFNGRGQLAGYTFGAGQELRAFFYDGARLHDIRVPLAPRVAPQALNDAGRLVGTYWDEADVPHAFSWSPAGGLERVFDDVGASGTSVLALNGSGAVGGFGRLPGAGQAGLLALPGEAGTRNLLAEAGLVAVADLNERNQVLGRTLDGSVLWSPSAAPLAIGAPGEQADAMSLNERGEVAGVRRTASGGRLPFHWSAADGLTDLGGDAGYRWTLVDIDEAGRIAGHATETLGPGIERHRPFVWSRAGGLRYLEVPGGRSARLIARDGHGQVVGYLVEEASDRAVVWSETQGLVVLGERLRDAPDGLLVQQATAIAPDGTIAAISNLGPLLLVPLH